MVVNGKGASNAHARLLIRSYNRWTGKHLIEPGREDDSFDRLFRAPIVVLSHGTESDPVLNFGNEAALRLWEMDWSTFTATPSRFTAEPMEQAERDKFFQRVTEYGFVDNYTGIRISSSGRRFYIVDAVVWNLLDEGGRFAGQAAAFAEYRYV